MSEIQTLYNGDSLFDIRRKINENFDFTQQQLESLNTDPLIRFTANSGNETNGVADLLNREADGTTLTFKVGGQYPNLVYTNAKGETTEVSSLDPLYMQNLQADTYIILVNGTSTQITSATFHYQLTEPTEIENGDIWFNGNGAYQYLNVGGTVQWMDYPYTPIGEAQYRTDKIAFSTTYAYNLNKIHEASTSAYGLMRVAAPVDETDCSCSDASITPANLYGLNDYRITNTAYKVGDTVACPYHSNLRLRCTTAGTTSGNALDTKTVTKGTTLTDGTVKWYIEDVVSDLQTSVNNKLDKTGTAVKATADGNGNNIVNTYRKISDSYTKTEVDNKIANSTGTGDGKSITKTSDNKLQAVGVLDARNTSTALKTWTGTRAQYDAIATKDNNTIYNITDDTDVTLSLLEILYPVGAIYIGTMATCPLQVLGVGNWVLKASDRVLQGAGANSVGSTVEAGLPNIEGSASSLWCIGDNTATSGAISKTSVTKPSAGSLSSGGANRYIDLALNASDSNPIYGKSNTVQPPAYIVNIWERIS